MAPPTMPGGPPATSWSGRFAVDWTPATSSARERASGRFLLRAQGSKVELDVYSTFGQTIAKAEAGPDGASLETANGERHQAPNPEALTEQVLGWRVPVTRLPAWLRKASDNGSTGRFLDSGWAVEIPVRDSPQAATRLSLRWPESLPAPDARQVTIRLVLDAPGLAAQD